MQFLRFHEILVCVSRVLNFSFFFEKTHYNISRRYRRNGDLIGKGIANLVIRRVRDTERVSRRNDKYFLLTGFPKRLASRKDIWPLSGRVQPRRHNSFSLVDSDDTRWCSSRCYVLTAFWRVMDRSNPSTSSIFNNERSFLWLHAINCYSTWLLLACHEALLLLRRNVKKCVVLCTLSPMRLGAYITFEKISVKLEGYTIENNRDLKFFIIITAW